MFTAFSLTIDEKEMYQLEAGQDQAPVGVKASGKIEADREKARQRMRECVDSKCALNADVLQNGWFQDTEARVFLSHSHKDEALAYRLAGWLYEEFGIVTFIDSYVWEYADELMKENAECGSRTPIILDTALSKMIDHCECILFLNTHEALKDTETRHEAAWIYSELETSRLTTKKKPERFKKRNFALAEGTQLRIKFDDDFKNLIPVDFEELKKWHDRYKNISENVYSLDLLYLHKRIIL